GAAADEFFEHGLVLRGGTEGEDDLGAAIAGVGRLHATSITARCPASPQALARNAPVSLPAGGARAFCQARSMNGVRPPGATIENRQPSRVRSPARADSTASRLLQSRLKWVSSTCCQRGLPTASSNSRMASTERCPWRPPTR